MNAVVIDDEKNALDVMAFLLKNYCPEVNVLRLCHGGEAGVQAIRELRPQLVFLDIEMPRINGFDVLDMTRDHKYKVIFTTAYDQFAIKAFKYSAVDYLLKPIDIEDIKAAIRKVSDSDSHSLDERIQSLYEYFRMHTPPRMKFCIPVGDGFEMFEHDEIIRRESDSNYTTLYLKNQRKITLAKTLKDVEENILNHGAFFRVHHSHMVNLNYVSRLFKSDGGYIVLNDGTNINISRNKKDQLFEMLQHI